MPIHLIELRMWRSWLAPRWTCTCWWGGAPTPWWWPSGALPALRMPWLTCKERPCCTTAVQTHTVLSSHLRLAFTLVRPECVLLDYWADVYLRAILRYLEGTTETIDCCRFLGFQSMSQGFLSLLSLLSIFSLSSLLLELALIILDKPWYHYGCCWSVDVLLLSQCTWHWQNSCFQAIVMLYT